MFQQPASAEDERFSPFSLIVNQTALWNALVCAIFDLYERSSALRMARLGGPAASSTAQYLELASNATLAVTVALGVCLLAVLLIRRLPIPAGVHGEQVLATINLAAIVLLAGQLWLFELLRPSTLRGGLQASGGSLTLVAVAGLGVAAVLMVRRVRDDSRTVAAA